MTTSPDEAVAPVATGDELYRVSDLNAGYGRLYVLQDVSFSSGLEPLGMVGRNGMGKSTLAQAMVGLIRPYSGSFQLDGRELTNLPTYKINRAGVGYVPQGRRIFPSLTVEENLRIIITPRSAKWNIDTVYDLFPRLAERRRNGGTQLSGGEQQMLAIGRALLANPKLIILDEPSEGLAPAVVDHLGEVLGTLVREGQAVLLIEQNLRLALEVCSRILVMVNGRIAADLTAQQLKEDRSLQTRYLGVV